MGAANCLVKYHEVPNGRSLRFCHRHFPLVSSAKETSTTQQSTSERPDGMAALAVHFPQLMTTSAPSVTMAASPQKPQKKLMSQQELKSELSKLPPLNVETLTRVLRTLFLWTSWIHEDVGHAWASFVYNPIHTPGFVPLDGRGICSPALIYRVAMFRNFVALERRGSALSLESLFLTILAFFIGSGWMGR